MTEEKAVVVQLALHTRELNPTDRLVLALLAMSADRRWVAWISVGTVASKLGVPHRTVQRALKRLSELGYIRRFGLPYERPRFVVEIGKLIPREADVDAGSDANGTTGMVGMRVLEG